MRISTLTAQALSIGNIRSGMQEQIQAQQQLSTGRRIVNPSDDPVASARALDLTQSQNRTDQFVENTHRASEILTAVETQYTAIQNNVFRLSELAINANNGALSDKQLQSLSVEVEGSFRALLGVANTRGADGQYLFAGYQSDTQPFTETAVAGSNIGTVAYGGDQGVRLIQISESRVLPVSEAGSSVFGDLFSTIKTLYDAMQAGRTSPTYTTDLQAAQGGLTRQRDNISNLTGIVGARQQELDGTKNAGEDLSLQYQSEISNLTQVDYTDAISKFTQSQQLLEVSRKVYQQVQSLSLFNYL